MMTRDEIRFCLQAMGMTVEQILHDQATKPVLSESESEEFRKVSNVLTELYVDLCMEPGQSAPRIGAHVQ